jgi:PHD-finger
MEVEVEEVVQQDDRLYCLCKTPYEEEKIMIACDRCDEWYHPACVGMVEAEVDLVDQFICASCGARECRILGALSLLLCLCFFLVFLCRILSIPLFPFLDK